jgi:uncharacterized protein involved in type VI secretion and phage assembly
MQQTMLQQIFDARLPTGYGGNFYGVYVGQVVDNSDPDGQGRVRIKLPWSPDSGDSEYQVWARLATMMAGNNRGTWFIPDVDDEVLVAFNAGDPRHPYVVGTLWNGKDAPPETMDANNQTKTIQSRNGVRVSLSDKDGQESLTLETPGGQKMVLKDGPGSVEIADSNGNSVKMELSGITVNASAKVTLNASVVEVSAAAVKVTAGTSTFSGVVHAQAFITPSVVGASYTPGAGNIW